ncbi:MAG: restriction endonuclease subunit S [Bacteroidales bacterium]|nr:restriction endonuclease subunit S [Bacteroidales bacterium]
MKVQIGDICTPFSGFTPAASELFPSGKYPYFKVAEMNREANKRVMTDTDAYVKESRKIFPKGAIVFPKNGAAIATNKKRILGQDSIVDLNTGGVKPNADLVGTDYLFYLFQQIDFAQYMRRGAVPTLDLKSILLIEIDLPSHADQQRIVAELDLLSGIVEKKKAQLKTLDDLAQSIFHEMFGDVKEKTTLSTYVTELSGGKSLAGDEENQYKVLKTGAVTYDYFRGDDVKNLPLDYIPREEDRVHKGDLLISRMNTAELVGAVAYVWDVKPNVYLPDRLWRATLTEGANPIFIWKALIQFDAKQQIRSLASGTSGTMKNISKPKLLSVTIPLVCRERQDAFAQRLQAIERQRNYIEESKKAAIMLFSSRMDKYFNV